MLTRLLNAPVKLQTFLAIMFALICVALIGLLSVAFISTLAVKREQLTEARERAGRLQQLVALGETLGNVPEELLPDDAKLFIDAPSVALARARLQQTINDIAGANGISIASAGNLPDLTDNGIKLIGLRIDLAGPYENVGKMVLGIETGLPPLIIKELAVRSAGPMMPEESPELAAQFRVYAAVRTAEAE